MIHEHLPQAHHPPVADADHAGADLIDGHKRRSSFARAARSSTDILGSDFHMNGVKILWNSRDWADAVDKIPAERSLPCRTVLGPRERVAHVLAAN